jgi:hypothetical protein
MQRLEVSCAVRPIYGSLGAKGLRHYTTSRKVLELIPGGVTGEFFRGTRQFHVPGVDSAS